MEQISKVRENTLFPTQIDLWGKIIEIKNQGKYKELIAQYKKFNTEKPAGYEEILKVLDKDLAEQIILDQNKMIEFSSTEKFEWKTAEEEAKASFERLNKDKKYEKKIELIKKKDGKEMHFVIKRTKKQLEEIERAEKAYELLHGVEAAEPVQQQPAMQIVKWPNQWVPTMKNITEADEELKNRLRKLSKQLENIKIGETIELTPPNGGLIRLQKKDKKGRVCLLNTVEEFRQYIDKNHSVEDENSNKSYISYVSNDKLRNFLQIPEDNKSIPEQIIEPILEPVTKEGEIWKVIEHTATISDTTQITRAIAERQAGEKLRKIYKNTARYKPRSRPTKAALFLGRWYMKDHYTRKYMKINWGMQRDENLVKWADRHAMELENNFKNIDKLATIDETNYPETYKEIQIIKDKLIQGAIDKDDFKKDFKYIIEDKTLDASNPVSKIMKENDIQQMSSNVVEDVLAFRDHQKLVKEITTYMFQHPTLTANDPVEERNFDIFSRDKIVKYFKTYQKNPAFLKTLNIKFDDADAMKKLSNFQAHHGALTMIAKQTMMLKVQILTKGEEAYDVKQEGWAMTKIGNRLDKPISDKNRFGKRLEKHPFAKWAFGTLRGITKLWVMITPAILLAPLGPLAVAGWAGGMAFANTLFKKYAHYNKEHIGYQRNQAVNLFENRKEREKLMNEIGKMNPASRFFYYYFWLGKKARDVRQFKDYVLTTHDQLKDSKTLANDINNLLIESQLDGTKPRQLEDLVGQALARLNYHKKTGQNFLGSENKDVAEKEYQNIYRLVLTGAMRLDKKLDEFENTRTYKREMEIINGNPKIDTNDNIWYQKARKRFKQQQTKKALVGAVKAWWIAFGLSYLATNLASTKESTTTLSDNTSVKENFVLGGHETSAGNGVYAPSKTFFDASTTANHNVAFAYGWGTDLTQVIPGHLTPAEYATKLADVTKEINAMAINSTTKTNLLSELTKQPWLGVTGQENAVLHNMRCVEGIEQIAKALNESTNAANIIIAPHYAPSVLDVTAATYNNAGERVVQWVLGYSQTMVTPEHIIPIPIPGYMNTFKESDRYYKEDKKSTKKDKWNEDIQERKTRSPAPKVEKQTENNDQRRISGEKEQFTNANN